MSAANLIQSADVISGESSRGSYYWESSVNFEIQKRGFEKHRWFVETEDGIARLSYL
jgi:hypothetical protein